MQVVASSILSHAKTLLTLETCNKQHWHSWWPSYLSHIFYATHFV